MRFRALTKAPRFLKSAYSSYFSSHDLGKLQIKAKQVFAEPISIIAYGFTPTGSTEKCATCV